jgi:opacity protein-like surface antigen
VQSDAILLKINLMHDILKSALLIGRGNIIKRKIQYMNKILLALPVLIGLASAPANAAANEDKGIYLMGTIGSLSYKSGNIGSSYLYEIGVGYSFPMTSKFSNNIEARIGFSSTAKNDSLVSGQNIHTETDLNLSTLFLKPSYAFTNSFGAYGLIGTSKVELTATASSSFAVVTQKASKQKFVYGVGATYAFGNRKIGFEYIKRADSISTLGLSLTRQF